MKPFILNAASSTDICKQSSDETNANSQTKIISNYQCDSNGKPSQIASLKNCLKLVHTSLHTVFCPFDFFLNEQSPRITTPLQLEPDS